VECIVVWLAKIFLLCGEVVMFCLVGYTEWKEYASSLGWSCLCRLVNCLVDPQNFD
jgi:hypothetical protein